MTQENKTKEELIEEIKFLQRRIAKLERLDSERKQTEEMLRESEEKYRFIFDNIPLSVGITTLDGKAVIANHGCEELTGYTKEEFSALKDVSEMYVDRAQRKQLIALLQKEGKGRDFEAMLKRKDGTVYHALMNVDFIKLKGAKVILTTVRDITGRKKIEESLRESENKFRSIFSNANDGIISVDLGSSKFFNANRKMIEMLGCESEEEIERLTVSDIHPREELAYVMREFQKHANGEISISEDIPVKRKDGSVFFAAISSSPLIVDNKRCLLVFFRDITERKKMEEEMRKRLQELEVFYKASVGREERIIELKNEIEMLKKELGR